MNKLTYNDIEQALRDYYWMTKEVYRLEKQLDDIEVSVTAQYGTESAMPKAKSGNSDTIVMTLIKREEESKHIKKLKSKIAFVDEGLKYIQSDLDKAVMLCIMDGLSQFQISQHFKISEGKVSSIKSHIVKRLFDRQNERFERSEGFEELCNK